MISRIIWWKAAKNGHLDILKWGREIDAVFGDEVSVQAALGGHLDILIWMKQNGLAIADNVGAVAADYEVSNVLKWWEGLRG